MYLEELFSLKGKTAVVTGGNMGIGRAVAAGLAKAGADIVIFSRSDARDAIDEIQQAGVSAYHLAVDVTSPERVNEAIGEVERKNKTIDIVFNNAGVTQHVGVLDATPEDFQRVVNINLNGEYYVAQAAAKVMVRNKTRGSIINMASMSAHIVNIPNLQCAYNSSKAAVIHMTRSLAVELVEYGIRVNSISPGYISTPMSADVDEELKRKWYSLTPMGRMGAPEELIPAVLYLASDASGFTTGSDVVVDGGYTCI